MKPPVEWRRQSLRETAIAVSQHLSDNGIKAVLVVGACVCLHTDGQCLSWDLDFVTHETLHRLEPVMAKIGFSRKTRHFSHPDCDYAAWA